MNEKKILYIYNYKVTRSNLHNNSIIYIFFVSHCWEPANCFEMKGLCAELKAFQCFFPNFNETLTKKKWIIEEKFQKKIEFISYLIQTRAQYFMKENKKI